MRLPAVRLRIVTLHLPEYGGLRNLTSILHAVAGTRRGQRRALLPCVERRQVNMVKIGVVLKRVEAAADDMDIVQLPTPRH